MMIYQIFTWEFNSAHIMIISESGCEFEIDWMNENVLVWNIFV